MSTFKDADEVYTYIGGMFEKAVHDRSRSSTPRRARDSSSS